MDSGGAAGLKKEVSFTVAGPAPAVRVTGVRKGGESRDFSAGMRLGVDKATVLVGTALFANPQKSVEASVQGGPARALSLKKGSRPGEMTFELPLSPELPYGRIEVRFSATDALGRRGETLAVFYRVDEGPAGADTEGISFLDSPHRGGRHGAAAARRQPGGDLQRPADPGGAPRAGKRLPERGLRRPLPRRHRRGEGLQEGVRLHLTTIDGDTFRSDPYTFHVDAAAPRLEVSSPATGDWAGGGSC